MLDRRRCAVALEPSSPSRDPRRRVLDEFVRTVARVGYEHTTIEGVFVRAKVPEPVFYEHFEDLQDCMLAALDEQLCWIENAVSKYAARSETWPGRVHRGLLALLETLACDPEGTRLALVECLAAGEPAVARLHRAVAGCVPALEQGLSCPRPPASTPSTCLHRSPKRSPAGSLRSCTAARSNVIPTSCPICCPIFCTSR